MVVSKTVSVKRVGVMSSTPAGSMSRPQRTGCCPSEPSASPEALHLDGHPCLALADGQRCILEGRDHLVRGILAQGIRLSRDAKDLVELAIAVEVVEGDHGVVARRDVLEHERHGAGGGRPAGAEGATVLAEALVAESDTDIALARLDVLDSHENRLLAGALARDGNFRDDLRGWGGRGRHAG